MGLLNWLGITEGGRSDPENILHQYAKVLAERRQGLIDLKRLPASEKKLETILLERFD